MTDFGETMKASQVIESERVPVGTTSALIDKRLLTDIARDLFAACKAVAYESDRETGRDVLVGKLRFQKVLDAIAKAESQPEVMTILKGETCQTT